MSIVSFFSKQSPPTILRSLMLFSILLLSFDQVSALTIFSGQTATIRWTSNNVQPGTCLARNNSNPGTVWFGTKADNDGGTGYSYTIPANTFPNINASYSFTFGCYSDPASTSAGAWIEATDIITVKASNVSLLISNTNTPNPLNVTPTLSFTSSRYYLSKTGGSNYTDLTWNYSDTEGTCIGSKTSPTANDTSWTGTKTTQNFQRIYNSNSANGNNLIETEVEKTYTLTCSSTGKPDVPFTLAPVIFEGKPDPTSGCFIAGTKVLMADGSKKNIESVTLDDHLMTSGGPQEVMKTYKIEHKGKLYAFNNSGHYFVSPTHPFMTTEGWKSVDPEGTRRESPGIIVSELHVGDNLVLHGDRYMTLTALDSVSTSTTVYNFGINGTHDYYADDYLVHNVSMTDIFEKAYALQQK